MPLGRAHFAARERLEFASIFPITHPQLTKIYKSRSLLLSVGSAFCSKLESASVAMVKACPQRVKDGHEIQFGRTRK